MLKSSAEQTSDFLKTGIGEFSLGELTCQLCRRRGKAFLLDHLAKDLLAFDLALWPPGAVVVYSCRILSVIVPAQALYHLSSKKAWLPVLSFVLSSIVQGSGTSLPCHRLPRDEAV